MAGLDYKKEYKDLYLPGRAPAIVEVPAMRFVMVDGRGAPGGPDYQAAMQALYALSFTIKMSRLAKWPIDGYFEYVVPPLEGLWSVEGGAFDWTAPRERWRWTSMIRLPDFVTEAVFQEALRRCREKKPQADLARARFERFAEGLCVQALHVGPYNAEAETLERMRAFLGENGLADDVSSARPHHEIYLSDPRRTAPERLKTVLRTPARRL